MKRTFYVVANWKANKTVAQAVTWWREFVSGTIGLGKSGGVDIAVIICASFIHLSTLDSLIKEDEKKLELDVFLGAQDTCPFGGGAFTGEVSAEMMRGLADYVLIGHSERRRYFSDDNERVKKKMAEALRHGLKPIICLSDIVDDTGLIVEGLDVYNEGTFLAQMELLEGYQGQAILAYEPLAAVGVGHRVDTVDIRDKIVKIRKQVGAGLVFYGGSVDGDNVGALLKKAGVDGVLVGRSSLDAKSFVEIIRGVLSIR